MKNTKRVTRMAPSKNESIPFATMNIPAAILTKLDRNFRDLEVNNDLRGHIHIGPPSGPGILGLYVTEEKAPNALAAISAGLKPLVTVKTWAGLVTSFRAFSAAVVKKYGKQQAETKARKTA